MKLVENFTFCIKMSSEDFEHNLMQQDSYIVWFDL